MPLKAPDFLVDTEWLVTNLNNEDLIILNCTIPKVGEKENFDKENEQIKNARFFDIKNNFSDSDSKFPNTVLSALKFEEQAQKLGINQSSCIVVYDDLGIYSSARVWWNFQLMGFTNIAVLNGGFPAWNSKKYPTEKVISSSFEKGDFKATIQPEKLSFKQNIFSAINTNKYLIIDARSFGRFIGKTPEPRNNVKSGRIPNSINLPFTQLFEGNILKTENELLKIFLKINPKNKKMIFSCGSGITASILFFVATLCGFKNTSVYDGSWTEWGSSNFLPIEI